jgi:hypothetical protein
LDLALDFVDVEEKAVAIRRTLAQQRIH